MSPQQKAKIKHIKRRIFWRRIGIVAWVSFVMAAVATMIFFAMFDPEALGHVTTFPIELSRTQGYSMGFFLFWALTATTGSILNAMLALPMAKLRKPMPHSIEADDELQSDR